MFALLPATRARAASSAIRGSPRSWSFAIALGISVCMITLTTYRAAANKPAGDRRATSCSRRRSTAGIPRTPTTKTTSRWRRRCSRIATRRALHASRHPGPQGRSCTSPAGSISRADKGMDPQYFAHAHDHSGLLRDVRSAVPVRRPLGRQGGCRAGARDRAQQGGEREGLRRREQRRQDAALARIASSASIGVLDDWEPDAQVLRREQRRVPGPGGRLRAASRGARSSSSAATAIPIAGRPRTIDSFQAFLNSECIWFAGLGRAAHAPTSSAPSASSSTTTSSSRRSIGRFPRPLNN